MAFDVDNRHIDVLGQRASKRALAVDAYRLDLEVRLCFQQLDEPQPHGWMVVDHHQAQVPRSHAA